jgi:hypothetical protein
MFIITLLVSANLKGQNCGCYFKSYDSSTFKPIKLFFFKNNKTLALYGDQNLGQRDTSYSGIAICYCNKNRIVYDMVDFGMINFKLKKIGDSLFVEELVGIPNGKNYKHIWQPFYVTKFFFDEDSLVEKVYFKKSIKKYTQTQIADILDQYKRLKEGDYDHIIVIANRLFWAYISGSREAEIAFQSFSKKFGPFDGAFAEEWNDLYGTYDLWKKLAQ